MTLFTKEVNKHSILVQIYVDDIIFGSTDENLCREFESIMKSQFEMSMMGELSFFLGLEVQQKEDGILIHQAKYTRDILAKYNLSDCKPSNTPFAAQTTLVPDLEGPSVNPHTYRSMIGSLMYLTASRPDIMWAVGCCARFQSNPKQSHETAVKRIFRYLKGTPKLGLWYPKSDNFDLIAYSDSDHAGCRIDRKSVSGGCQFLGNRLVSWQSKKQTTVSISTAQAEYTAASSCCCQVLWIQNQLLDYGLNIMRTPIYIDNDACRDIVKNPIDHSKTKHIEIRIHSIRDAHDKGYIQVLPIDTADQKADIFTKAFDKTRFRQLVTWLEMINFE
jgi:hypothetical protein